MKQWIKRTLAGALEPQGLSERRNKARASLRTIKIRGAAEGIDLDCARDEVVDESESFHEGGGRVEAYYLTQIVRNSAGEYFLVKSTDQKPFIKHLSQDRAKLVLKAKYRPPGAAASDA